MYSNFLKTLKIYKLTKIVRVVNFLLRSLPNFNFQFLDWLNTTDGVSLYNEAIDPAESFVYDCSLFGKGPFYCASAMKRVTTLSGICYTLSDENHQHLNKQRFYIDRAGPKFGLKLQVNVFQDEYSMHAESAGVGIQVSL